MAEANIRAALKDCYKELNTRYARRQIDKQTQIVLVSRFNLREAFIEAYGRAKIVQPELMDLDAADFSNAATAALEAIKNYVRTSKSATIKSEGVTFVKFVQRSGRNTMPFIKAKFAGKKVLEAAAKVPLTRQASVAINQSIVRSHEGGMTTGMQLFASMFDEMKTHPDLEGFITSVEATRLTDKFSLNLYFEKDPIKKGKFVIKAGQRVILEVLKSSDNPAGRNANDWILIKPKLEAATVKWAKRVNWPDKRGSAPPSEEIAERSANSLKNTILVKRSRRQPFIVTVKGFQKEKTSTKKQRVTYTPPRDSRKTNLKFAKKRSTKGLKDIPALGASEINLSRLLIVLNDILPQMVADNMGSPALNYRTGRFAESVRVTDIHTTKRGTPSIGYTYMKYPYQTFEPGYAQGSPARDPRTLIDSAIRDAARGLMTAKFTTRRV